MRRRTAGNPVSSLAASQFSVQLLTHIDPRYSRNDQTAKEGWPQPSTQWSCPSSKKGALDERERLRSSSWTLKELGGVPARLSDPASAALRFSQGSLFLFSGCSPRVCTGKLLHRWDHPFDEVLGPPPVDFYSLKLRAHTTQNHSKHLQNFVTVTIYNMKSRTGISSI